MKPTGAALVDLRNLVVEEHETSHGLDVDRRSDRLSTCHKAICRWAARELGDQEFPPLPMQGDPA